MTDFVISFSRQFSSTVVFKHMFLFTSSSCLCFYISIFSRAVHFICCIMKPIIYWSQYHSALHLFTESLFNAFATAAFFKFVVFSIFEMRYLLAIWKANRPLNSGEGWESMRRELSVLYSRFCKWSNDMSPLFFVGLVPVDSDFFAFDPLPMKIYISLYEGIVTWAILPTKVYNILVSDETIRNILVTGIQCFLSDVINDR